MALELSAKVRPATVAIVGRPNVGKSALFNRLVGKRLAIVDDTPGVTRDRLYALTEWNGRTFSVIDTAGIDPDALGSDDMARQTRAQAEIAANDADVIVFVVDAAAGLSPLDDDVVMIMRKTRRPVVLVANKAESERVKAQIPGEFARLGFGEPIAVSALHGEGTGDLLDAIVERLPQSEAAIDETELALAIVGRPNVGKSSLLNALLGEDRSIVSDVAGTTRDAIDTLFDYNEHKIRLIDTAGVWRKTKHHGSIEYYASLRSLGAIARCDIAILVVDVMTGILDQDRRLAGMVLEERKGLIIVANKWDLALQQDEEYSQPELTQVIHENIPFAAFAPVTFLSATTKRRLNSLMPLVMKVTENLDRRIPTPQLNSIVRDAVYAHAPPNHGGHPLKIYYAAQVATHPPLFIFHCNDPDLATPSYKRFLENTLRANFDFEGVPLNLEFRARREDDSART
ncbi:MAG: ribosome biogenesis GTPase Der [Candidatus Eremiobacteraeota bacterium]|nr:ribosome biogenesis GTPase Der [Candidatus Eremiobacteraeota bacterium]